MTRIGSNIHTAYRTCRELSDGRDFELVYITVKQQNETDPSEYEAYEIYLLNGKPCERSQLPPEITAEVIAELINNASEDRSYDFGLPDDP